jgi:transketolase
LSSSGISCRHAFTSALLEEARANPRIFAVTSDSKGSVTLDNFEKALPVQFVEIGIAEQNAVGIGAGLARSGKRVFVCGPASFYSARSVEQVKNDVAYSGADVKIVGVSGGVSYGALGSTHHSLHDIALYRAIPNLSVIIPADTHQTSAATSYLARHPGPVYMRIGRAAVPDVYSSSEESFEFGKAMELRSGTDCTIVACGETVHHALSAEKLLRNEGVTCTVLDMPTIKPIDQDAVIRAAKNTGRVVTIEEHSIYGGLGSAVAEILSQNLPVPLRILGFPDEFVPAGESAALYDYYGLTGPKLAVTIGSFVYSGRKSSRTVEARR